MIKNIKLKVIIGTDHDDKFVISESKELTIILNEGNDIIEFAGANNIISFKKHAGKIVINNIHNNEYTAFSYLENFIIDVDKLEDVYCWQFLDSNNILILDTSLLLSEYSW